MANFTFLLLVHYPVSVCGFQLRAVLSPLPVLRGCFKACCPFLCVRPKDHNSVRLLYLAGEDLTIFFALRRILDHFIKMGKQLFREKGKKEKKRKWDKL